jgi:replicative DNA helicase
MEAKKDQVKNNFSVSAITDLTKLAGGVKNYKDSPSLKSNFKKYDLQLENTPNQANIHHFTSIIREPQMNRNPKENIIALVMGQQKQQQTVINYLDIKPFEVIENPNGMSLSPDSDDLKFEGYQIQAIGNRSISESLPIFDPVQTEEIEYAISLQKTADGTNSYICINGMTI